MVKLRQLSILLTLAFIALLAACAGEPEAPTQAEIAAEASAAKNTTLTPATATAAPSLAQDDLEWAEYSSPALSLVYPSGWSVDRGPFPGSFEIGTVGYYSSPTEPEDVAVYVTPNAAESEEPVEALEEFQESMGPDVKVLTPVAATKFNGLEAATASYVCDDLGFICQIAVIAGADRSVMFIAYVHESMLETMGPIFETMNESVVLPLAPPLDFAELREDAQALPIVDDVQAGFSVRHSADWELTTGTGTIYLLNPVGGEPSNTILSIVSEDNFESLLPTDGSLEEIVTGYWETSLHVTMGDVLPVRDLMTATVEGQSIAWQLFGTTGATAWTDEPLYMTIIVAAIEHEGLRFIAVAYIEDDTRREEIETMLAGITVTGSNPLAALEVLEGDWQRFDASNSPLGEIESMSIDNQGRAWFFSSDDELHIYNIAADAWSTHSLPADWPFAITSDAIAAHGDQVLLSFYVDGLFYFDGATWERPLEGITRGLGFLPDGTPWANAGSGGADDIEGFWRYDGDAWNLDEAVRACAGAGIFEEIRSDAEGRLWASRQYVTGDSIPGVWLIEGEECRQIFTSEVFSIAPTSQGSVWISASETGIVELDAQGEIVRELENAPALFDLEPVAVGPDGSLWLTTEQRLFRVTPEGEWVSYALPGAVGLLGLYGELVQFDQAGRLWVVGDDWVAYLPPEA